MGKIDIAIKEMAKRNLASLVSWLNPELREVTVVEMPQELPATLRHVDVLLKALAAERDPELMVVESQVEEDGALLKTLLLRAVLVHHFYDLPVRTLLLALTPRAVVPERYEYGRHRGRRLCHGVEVRRIYLEAGDLAVEQAPDAVLPLVPLMRTGDRRRLLAKTLERIASLELNREDKRLYLAWTSTFATLRLRRAQIDAIVKDVSRRRNFMLNALRDLPLLRETYQEGVEEGVKQGVKQGVEQGAQALRQAVAEALEERLGPLSPAQVAQLGRCDNLIELAGLLAQARQARGKRQAQRVLDGLKDRPAPRKRR